RPGHGGHRHTRRESYWDRVDVSMQGQLPIELDIPFPRWLPDSLVKALRDEAHAWFHIGATREAADTARDRISRVRREAEALTHEIRDMLESVAARGG
ncbi:MAG: hypothetical protein JJ992_08235, partial [Planctomycetes bacterium]|nr:hypothetical protein [Planctomycetota bacterium]